jgi:transglutaminase/protease-like cytokinesis protein 3
MSIYAKQSLLLKAIILCIAGFISLTSMAQPGSDNAEKIDRKILKIPVSPPAILASHLIAGMETEWGKVRAIFRWITANISYKGKESTKKNLKLLNDEDTVFYSLDERIACSVLENKVAVCEGYARLFKTLCDYAGIRSEIIHGYARNGTKFKRFGINHSWNAVMIDNNWKLIDLAWASGYITDNGKVFVHELDEQYFLPSPARFIIDHYPDDLQWTLMDDPPLMPEFRYSPFKQRSFVKYKFTEYSPAKGIIEAVPDELIKIELKTSDILRDRQIGADPFLDTSIYRTSNTILLIPSEINGNKIVYHYCVNSLTVEWLYILYNDDVVLRYRLEVRKSK